MSSVKNVGKLFETGSAFLSYLEGLSWGTWRPKFLTLHHCAMPTLAVWSGWQVRKPPVSDEQWLKNLATYYGNTLGWRAAPHFFITPRHIGVLSPPTARGVHAVEFNALSWGMEVVGNFDSEAFVGPIKEMTLEACAACHIAMGWSPSPFVKSVRGLHFHRDDSTTRKSCPGKRIDKPTLQLEIAARMVQMQESGDGDHPQEQMKAVPSLARRVRVKGIAQGDSLNVRADASARAPVVRTLGPGAVVQVLGEAQNGSTRWLSLGQGEWISAAYTEEAPK